MNPAIKARADLPRKAREDVALIKLILAEAGGAMKSVPFIFIYESNSFPSFTVKTGSGAVAGNGRPNRGRVSVKELLALSIVALMFQKVSLMFISAMFWTM